MFEFYSTTLFLAKAFGLYMIPVGLGLMVDPSRYRSWYKDILKQERRSMFGGVIALFIGAFVIASHNVWVADWPLLITLIGWWGFVKGGALLVVPGSVKVFQPMIDTPDMIYRLSGLFWLFIGLFLAYQGYYS